MLAITSATKSAKLSSLLFGYPMVAFPARMELPTALDYLRRLSSSELNASALTNSRFVELLAQHHERSGELLLARRALGQFALDIHDDATGSWIGVQ